MMFIPLTQDKKAVVDDEDFDWLNQWKWYARTAHGIWYAGRSVPGKSKGRQRMVHMHREVLGLLPGIHIDHINGNGLDNRRCNLRSATRSENLYNKRLYGNNTSGFKGVVPHWNRWRAYINKDGKRRNIGVFATKEEAAKAYDQAAIELHGSFARLNYASS